MANGEDRSKTASGGARIALVTGAASGIGRAIAAQLATDGLRVFGTSRKGGDNGPAGVEMLPLDVCNDASVSTCIDSLLTRAGRIDVLVNCAGYLHSGAVEETTIEEAKTQFETNFFGALRLINAVLPGMRVRKSGAIINVTSLAGVVPLPFWGVYNASKFALEGLTETLRYELRPFGISVSAIEPGSIKTAFYSGDHISNPIGDYAPWQRRFNKKMAEFEKAAPGPELVAKAVSKAVRAAKPALRYRVTREAFIFTTMRSWFPASIFETGLRSGFKLDDERY